MPTKALLIVNTAVHCFILRFILYSVQRFSGLSIASKMILSVIIWGFVDFGRQTDFTALGAVVKAEM